MERVSIGAHARVEAGEVGANLGILSLGAGARIVGGASAFEIHLRPGAGARRLNCLFIQGFKGFCRNVTIPLSSETLPLVQAIPGVTEVLVPGGRFSLPVAPASYGRIRVQRKGTLLLSGGAYTARQLLLAPSARLLCQSDCEISVSDRVRLGAGAAVRAANVDPVATLRINVLGPKSAAAVVTGTHSAVSGIVYAPTGAVTLGAAGRYIGTFIGRTVAVRPHAHLRFEQ